MPYTGLNGFAEYKVTAEGTFTAFDNVSDGEMGYNEGAVMHFPGLQGSDEIERGIVIPRGNVTTKVQSIDLMACALRTAIKNLPPVVNSIQGGVLADADAGRIQTSCYIDELRLSCEVGGPLMAEYTWVALTEEGVSLAAGSAAALKTGLIMWFNADVLIDGNNYECESWEATINNNLKPYATLDQGVTDQLRWPSGVNVGHMTVSNRVAFRTPTGIDVLGDAVDGYTFKFVGKDNGATPKTFTLDMTGGKGLHPGPYSAPLVSDDNEIMWSLEGEGKYNDLALWDITYA